MKTPTPKVDDTQEKVLKDSEKALKALALCMLAGLLVAMVYGFQAETIAKFVARVSVGVGVAGASMAIGGILGFIFGIPRSLQQEGIPANGNETVNQGAEKNNTPQVGYRGNTNLEQISDWLSKMLIGVGLTQINTLPGQLNRVADYIASGMGGLPNDPVFALALLVYFLVCGFLFGYLWARLFLAGALRQADLDAIGVLKTQMKEVNKQAVQANQKLDEFRQRSEQDAEALNLVDRQLNPSADLPPVTQQELDRTVATASRPIKVQIFNRAWQVRADNWRDPDTKAKMERTIPIFRALIKSDTENHYHMNHGQLGFALKDQRSPDWAAAEQELSEAIKIRGSWQTSGWLFYEFNRALCRIMLDEKFQQDMPSDKTETTAILEDLRAAAKSPEVRKIIVSNDIMDKWFTLNNIDKTSLR